MKTYFKQITKIILILAGVATIVASCTIEDDRTGQNGKDQQKEGDIEATFSLKLPNNSTRSLNLDDENELRSVKVMVFSQSGNFQYMVDAIQSSTSSADITVKQYSAKLTSTSNGEKVDLMIVANAESIINSKYPNGIPANQGITKDIITRDFTIEKSNGWLSSKDNSGYAPIPMWGLITGASIDGSNGLDSSHNTAALTRMLAKINVGITGEATQLFELTGVYLMNRNTVGRLIPGITTKDPWTGTSPKASEPSLPSDPKPRKGATNYLEYSVANTSGASRSEMKGVIYSFEAEKGIPYASTKEYEESPCLILGGKYKGSSTVTYYRVDFMKSGTNGEFIYLHLLRNYLYDVSISQVTGPGYPDIEEALKNRPINMIGSVVPWIDSDMPIQVSDGIHVLSVDKDLIQFYATGEQHEMTVYTDVSEGWRISTDTLPSWLHFVSPLPDNSKKVRGETVKYVKVILKADEISGNSQAREAKFTVEAGALKKDITVKQSNETEVVLNVSPNTLIFPYSAPEAKVLTVSSIPSNAIRIVNYTKTGTISFLPGKGPDSYNNTFANEFVLQPTPGTYGTAIVAIRISNSEGISATQVVYVVQLPTDSDFGFLGFPTDGYEAIEQGTKTIQIISSVPWKLEMANNPQNTPSNGNMITLTDLAEHPARAGVLLDYNFTLAQNPGYVSRTADVGVLSSAPNWQYFTFPLMQKGTLPYIELTAPTTKSYDFELGSNSTTVSFKTNAGWKITGDENYAKVVGLTDSTYDHAYAGSNNGLNIVERTVAFTPVSAENEMLKAGSKMSTVVRFETANHNTAAVDYDELVLSRTAKVRWGGVYYSYDEATNILTVTAYTNAEWRISSTNMVDTIIPADVYGPHPITFKIPGNEILDAATYTFSAGSMNNYGDTRRDTTISKGAASLMYVSYNGFPDTIPPEGMTMANSNYYLNFDGTYTGNFEVRVINNGNMRGTIVGGNTHIRRMSILPTDRWLNRVLTFEYQIGPNTYRLIENVQFVQRGYHIDGHTTRTELPASGASVTEYLNGYFPNMLVYADLGDGNRTVSREVLSGSTSVNLNIPSTNSWTDRRIIKFMVRDADQNIDHTVELSQIAQNNFQINPVTSEYVGHVGKGGSDQIDKLFTGDFPEMRPVSSNPEMVSAYPDIFYPGNSLTLKLSVTRNQGAPRVAEIYLKDANNVTRATMTIKQDGEDEYMVEFYKCGDWVKPETLKNYTVVSPAKIDGNAWDATKTKKFLSDHGFTETGTAYFASDSEHVVGSYTFDIIDLSNSASSWVRVNNTCKDFYVLLKLK